MTLFAGLALAIGIAGRGGPAGGVAARAAVPQSQVGEVAPTDATSASSVAPAVPLELGARPSDAASSSGADLGLAKISDRYPASGLAADGIPVTALRAYEQAARREAQVSPACGLSWPLLAGIGRVESDHGRFAGAILHSDGLSTPRVIGIPLNGQGTALIRDTDNGVLDGDTVYDRAVGPMQFIPSTWAGWGVDANGDGVKDPFNIFDAAAAAADYLCAAGRDLTTTHGQVQAILSYNWSWDYVSLVMGVERIYASGAVGITVPVLPTSPDPGGPVHPKLPPVDPGKPRGAGSGTTSQPTSPAPRSTPAHSPSPSTSSSQSTAPGGGSSSSSSSSTPGGGSSSSSSSSSSSASTPAPSSSDPQPCSATPTDSSSPPDPSCPSSSDSSSVSSAAESTDTSSTAAASSDASSAAPANNDPSSSGP